MKTILFVSILGMVTFGMHAAGGGGGAGGGGSAGSASTGSSPMTPVVPAQPTTPTGNGQSTTTPNQPGASTPSAVGASNNWAQSNQFMMNSNRFRGSNHLYPTGAASGTNGFQNNFRLRDHGLTASDQALLITLQGLIHTVLGIPGVDRSPVHLFIDNGAVTLVGFVPTAGEQQRILLQLQQTPGVVQVVNRLHVGMPPSQVTPENEAVNPSTQSQVNPLTPAFAAGQADRAFSAPDQRLLQEIRQSAAVQLGMNQNTPRNTLVTPQLPVRFVVQDGVVTVSGQVVTSTQGTALLAAIGQTPGVVRVVNNLQVGGVNATTVPGGENTTTTLPQNGTQSGTTGTIVTNQ